MDDQDCLNFDLSTLFGPDLASNNDGNGIDLGSDLLSSLLNTETCGLAADDGCRTFLDDVDDELKFFDAVSTFTIESIVHDHKYAKNTSESSNKSVEGNFSLAETPDCGYESMAISSPSGGGSGSDSESATLSSPGLSVSPQPAPPQPLCYTSPLTVLASFPIPRLLRQFGQKDDSLKPIELTEEEKEAFLAEGLPIPTTLPLTKVEEKTMKAVRRKLRNKACAAASRQKKKEYIETLERRVQTCTEENENLQKKVNSLQTQNRSLISELKRLRKCVLDSVHSVASSRSAQSGTFLMVLVLCFAFLFPQWAPVKILGRSTSPAPFDYTTPPVHGRALLDYEDDSSFIGTIYCYLRYFVAWGRGSTFDSKSRDLKTAETRWTLYSTDVGNNGTHSTDVMA